MFNLKKISAFLLATIILFSFASCSNNDNETPTDGSTQPQSTQPQSTTQPDSTAPEAMSCEDIIDAVYEKCGNLAFFEGLNDNDNKLVTTSIKPDGDDVYYGCSYYFGTSLSYASAAASEPDMQPPAYSFCVAIMPEGSDMEAAASAVEDNANPDKWVCTGVSTVYTLVSGDVLALIMADKDTADALKTAFESLDLSAVKAPAEINTEPQTEAETESETEAESETEVETATSPSDGSDEFSTADMRTIITDIYVGAKDSCARAETYFSDDKSTAFYEGIMTADDYDVFFGTQVDCVSALCSKSSMMPDAFFMALIQPKPGANIEHLMTSIKDNAHPDWQVCVSAEKVEVVENGGLILVIMGNENETSSLKTSFLALPIA